MPSTIHSRPETPAVEPTSSPKKPSDGNRRRTMSRSATSTARSVAVTGLPSGLVVTKTPPRSQTSLVKPSAASASNCMKSRTPTPTTNIIAPNRNRREYAASDLSIREAPLVKGPVLGWGDLVALLRVPSLHGCDALGAHDLTHPRDRTQPAHFTQTRPRPRPFITGGLRHRRHSILLLASIRCALSNWGAVL